MDDGISLRDAIFLSMVTGRGLDIMECTDPRSVVKGLLAIADMAAEEMGADGVFAVLLQDDEPS